MPIRFRRTFKILPGIKLNVSKGGLSTTVGRKGLSLNIGKRGLRQTVGMPGTGISMTNALKAPDFSGATPRKDVQTEVSTPDGMAAPKQGSGNTCLLLILAGVGVAVVAGCVIALAMILLPGTGQTGTPTSEMSSPLPILAPTLPPGLAPTSQRMETGIVPPSGPSLPARTNLMACECASDTLSCDDFQSRAEAQECFDKCRAAGVGDVHRLDGDGDLVVCESS